MERRALASKLLPGQRIIRTNQFSLVGRPQLAGGYALTLYDHVSDPSMSTDVQDQHPEILKALTKELQEWNIELDATNAPVQERSLDQEEALRSLGYIE